MCITKAKRLRVWEKSNKRCTYCRRQLTSSEFTIDHIIPRASFPTKSDADAEDNLCVCCRKCNSAKRNLSVKLFRSEVNRKNAELQKLEAERRRAIAQAYELTKQIEGEHFTYVHYLREQSIHLFGLLPADCSHDFNCGMKGREFL